MELTFSIKVNIINQSQENIKIFRHDINKHMLAVQTLVEKHKNGAALEYLQNTFHLINNVNEYAKSGNTELDSILNYKIAEAKTKNIEITLDLHIPEKLNVQSFALVVILGNLLDNAIEATSKLQGEKKIETSIKLERNVLYVSVKNPYFGELHHPLNKLKTTHGDVKNHGFGLESVNKVIEKYNGTLNIKHTDNNFCVDVLIYNPISVVEEREI